MIEKTYSFIKDGNVNDVYTLSNKNGCEVDVLTYGARLIRLSLPDKKGVFSDCLVGCKCPEDYYGAPHYFGATIGRYGNRIENSAFSINGTTYHVEANEAPNSLHGGSTANFDTQIWEASIDRNRLVMHHLSPDGAGGSPGNLEVWVSFELTDANELIIEYEATTDKDTPCNLTNHAYFNLGCQDTILNHELMINARQITPVDDKLIPHGEFMDIDGTAFSFLPAKRLGDVMFADEPMIQQCNGFDFNYCLERIGKGLEKFAYVYDPESGRKMDCYTTLPGVQLYTGCVTGGFKGKKDYVTHCALCLETQGYPNSPNCPEYPSTILKAGEPYHEITVYRFSVKKS